MKWIALLVLMVAPALGDDDHHGHPPADQSLHDKFYTDWKVPNQGNPRVVSCCNKQDCYPTVVKFDQTMNAWVALRREDQQWVVVPRDRLEQLQKDEKPSPDHQSHACIKRPGNGDEVVCATQGNGA